MAWKTGRGFASDNTSGVLPEVMAAILEANQLHTPAYGEDPWTEKAKQSFRRYFGEDIEVHFVFNGTAANVLSLAACVKPYEAIFCTEMAHIHEDECGAPEGNIGCKLITVENEEGKLTPQKLLPTIVGGGNQHHVQPRLISISQTTEVGTVYRPEEILALSKIAKTHQLYFHMDGARISNAAVALGLEFRDFTRDVGVDVLSFGGTKCGLLGAEAVVFFNPKLARDFIYLRKQKMQLASKMRFVSSQFSAFLDQRLWTKYAAHANHMAGYLKEKVSGIPALEIAYPVEANGVFVRIPKEVVPKLQKDFPFYVWKSGPSKDLVRWMMSFDTTKEDIELFADSIREALG
jgi:threonine aldolase